MKQPETLVDAAKRLGISLTGKHVEEPPKRPNASYVVGYFNSNNFPIRISISKYNLNIELRPGQFITDEHGRKVNDPVFENQVGAMRLSRETSRARLPVNFLKRPEDKVGDPHPIKLAKDFRTGPDRITQPTELIPQPRQPKYNKLPPPGTQAVMGMSREMAEKIGLVKPVVLPPESTITDTEGVPGRLTENVPMVEPARDATPREAAEAKKRFEEVRRKEEEERRVWLEKGETVQSPTQFDQVETVLNERREAAQQQTDSVEDSMPKPNLPDTDNNLPEADTNTPSEAPASTSSQDPFICQADGKTFKFRSQLERHVLNNFQSRYDELMAPYPRLAKNQRINHLRT